MTEEIEDALYSAAGITTRSAPRYANMQLPNHPRAIVTFHEPPLKVREFKAKLRAFLGEIDGTLTVRDLLDELE